MLRKINKILAFNLVIVFIASAQSFAPGLKAGFNLSSMYGDDVTSSDKTLLGGFSGGLLLDIKLTKIIAIQPELLYSQKGIKYENKINGVDFVNKIRFHYIEIPLLLKISISSAKILTPYLEIGPYCGFLIESNVSDFINNNEVFKLTTTDSNNRVEFGISSGFGSTFNTQNGSFILDLRFNIGLTSIAKESLNQDVKNVSFSLTFGYEFTKPLLVGHRSENVQKADASYLRFVGNNDGISVEVNDGPKFQIGLSNTYEINPGKHNIKIYRNDQLISQKEIYVGNHETKEIPLK